ncbi:MAG: DoxX family membrane protein [Candidatus Zixiibacteriota bacterium]|nr:MAG: DoxX family membrane protein [candidate division Zixibacteria bacterium]
MRRLVDNDYLTMVVRLAVGVTFIYASYYKILDPAGFAKSIWYYHLLPGGLINITAVILPWVELICGLGLIFGVLYRGAAVLTTTMTVIFTVALVSALARGIDIDCGCFKVARSSSETVLDSLLFDIVLLILLWQLLVSRSRRWMLSRW